jgi:hypothetical protein
MAACHPKLKTNPGAELFLSRFAEAEWRGVIRPWLEAGGGLLERAFLVAPTRGQTQALKQRCVVENIPLLGVEFLTPGLARRKRLPGVPLAPGLQELVLRTEIEDRLRLLGPEDPARGLWKSLASDLEAALGDFHELLRAGFKAADFRRRELGEVFGALVSWVERHRYALAPLEDEAAALEAPRPERAALADRLLILAGGAEGWGEFFGLVALAKRCARVTVVVAEPEFSGRGAGGEEWVALWNAVLGVEAAPIDAPDPADSCAAVAELWNGDGGSAERAEVIVGASRSDEIFLAAEAVVRLLERGGENIAVVFPRAGSAHARFAQHLADRGVPFTDLVGTAGTPPLDTLIQRALVDFYERGCRLEELLALWPLLGTLGLVRLSPGAARKACQGLFDETQQHGIEAPLSRLAVPAHPVRRAGALRGGAGAAELGGARGLVRPARVRAEGRGPDARGRAPRGDPRVPAREGSRVRGRRTRGIFPRHPDDLPARRRARLVGCGVCRVERADLARAARTEPLARGRGQAGT